MPRADRWPRVSRRQPCPICGKPDWCQISPDGAIAGCMRVAENAFKTRDLASGETCHYHRLTEAIPPPRPARPTPLPAPQPLDIAQARALYTSLADACAADLPDHARQDLAHRFGPHADAVIARWGIGYCPPGGWLPQQLGQAGQHTLGIAAGVLTRGGETVNTLAGRLVIPHRRGDQVQDVRGAGIKGHGHTGEQNLHGTYQDRQVEALYFNHDALDALPPGGTIHLAGGAWKTIALALAGLPAIGTRGEGELTNGHLAELVAHRVGEVVLHIDAEDPRPRPDGTLPPHGEGRRLGLHKAGRLAAAGLAVRVAEPPREPGAPKVDCDSLLRDHGPALLRAVAAGAIPLAAWRQALGLGDEPPPGDHPHNEPPLPSPDGPGNAAGLTPELAALRREYARLAEQTRRDEERRRALERDVAHLRERLAQLTELQRGIIGVLKRPDLKQTGRAAIGLALAWQEARGKGESWVDPETGERYVAVANWHAGQWCGLGDDSIKRHRTVLEGEGMVKTIHRPKVCTVRNRLTGALEEREIPAVYIHLDEPSAGALLARVAALPPPDKKGWGGQRDAEGTPSEHDTLEPPTSTCPTHPASGMTVTTTTRCRICAGLLGETVAHYDADGTPTDPNEPLVDEPAADSGDEPAPAAPAPADNRTARLPLPQLAGAMPIAGPPPPTTSLGKHRPRCLNAARGCPERTAGEQYCARCVADGWRNHPSTG